MNIKMFTKRLFVIFKITEITYMHKLRGLNKYLHNRI